MFLTQVLTLWRVMVSRLRMAFRQSAYTLAGHGEQAAHGLSAKVLTLWRAMVSKLRMAFSPKCLHFGGPCSRLAGAFNKFVRFKLHGF